MTKKNLFSAFQLVLNLSSEAGEADILHEVAVLKTEQGENRES